MLTFYLHSESGKINWANSKISIACDNQAVVQILNSEKTQDLILTVKLIQFHVAARDIDLKVTHISGKSNIVPDLLSRWVLIPQAAAR